MFHNEIVGFMQAHYVEILALLPAFVLLSGLLFAVGIDPYTRRETKQAMQILCVVVLTLIAQNFAEYLLMDGRPNIILRRIVAIYGYSIRPVILVLFMYVVSPRRNHAKYWIMVGVNAAIHMTALFSNICFTITEGNRYIGGLPVLSDSCLITSMILLGALLSRTIRSFQPRQGKETWIPLLAVFFILYALFLDSNVGGLSQPLSFLTIFIVIDCVMYYFWLHYQFAREHEKAKQIEQRVQQMLSQIKPHFLYNALGAIEELCDSNPAAAREATIRFSN